MKPVRFSICTRMRALLSAVFRPSLALSLLSSPAFAQDNTPEFIDASMVMDAAPLIIGSGALAFAILAMIWILRVRNQNTHNQVTGRNQIAQMRARLDEYEAVLSCMPEVTVLWQQSGIARMFGTPEITGVNGLDLSKLLDFQYWLMPDDAEKLSISVRHLHTRGENFAISVHTNSGLILRAVGRAAGDTAIMRLRSATASSPIANSPLTFNNLAEIKTEPNTKTDLQSAKTILAMLQKPAWIRNASGQLIFANTPYLELCNRLGQNSDGEKLPELFSEEEIGAHQSGFTNSIDTISVKNPLPGLEDEYDLLLTKLNGNTIAHLAHKGQTIHLTPNSEQSHINRVMDAMSSPMAVFDSEGKLKQFNAAYCALFQFDKDWLSVGLNEREIIDNLRRRRLLPAVSDYRSWRNEHLKSYALKEPRLDVWYLDDGRTLNIVATPDLETGGVIYMFEDITEQLKLQSANKAMLDVQRETLNALSEGVAVFGTDGRLRLHNPRLSSIWKLPMNQLGLHPHIDQLAEACGQSIPEDGEEIWQRLKKSIIDLDPGRIDKTGRIKRADGHLVDFAIVRLPNSQTMLTFVDVTKNANYELVLKERNEALETADRLKDAFVQNVSYELRSPLTSIIGFADLLASDNFGPLNEQQRTYTDYIKASSATLGTLIDNILDLTNVNAGIAKLNLEELDIPALIQKAQAGFSATMVSTDGVPPLNLAVTIPNDLPRFVADGARIVQILYNLLSNAAKFSESGAQINLIIETNDDWFRFIIEDKGVGVPKDLTKALASPDNGESLKGLQRGAGIGLIIVKTFVELHGGSLSMQPNSPRGSRVIVNLPADASKLIDQQIAQ